MNKVILIGRLTRDPECRRDATGNIGVAKYSLAVNRTFKDENGAFGVDYINCVAFGKRAEFVSKYLKQGMRIGVTGRIQTGSYVNNEGRKVYTTDIIVDDHEFCESRKETEERTNNAKNNNSATSATTTPPTDRDFVNVPETEEEELPF